MNTESYRRKIDVAVKPDQVFRALTKELNAVPASKGSSSGINSARRLQVPHQRHASQQQLIAHHL